MKECVAIPMTGIYTYYYGYTVTFLMKDNKFKIILDNVNCNDVIEPSGARYQLKCLPPFEDENYPGSVWEYNIAKKQQKEVMINLKNDLQLIVDNYIRTIKQPSLLTKEW